MKHVVCTPEENSRFQHLYEVTLNLCGAETDDCPVSTRPLKKWSDLANIWYDRPESIGCKDIFYTVLHHIHWGLYPDGSYSDELLELLEMVEYEVLDSGCANRSWLKRTDFKKAFNRFKGVAECDVKDGPGYHFYSSVLYLWHRTLNLVQYKFNDFSDCGFAGEDQYNDCYLDVRNHCYVYEQAIKVLIPDAANWDRKQWSDDRNIGKALAERYGIEFNRRIAYESLVGLIERACINGQAVPMSDSVMIEVLPRSIVELVWPNYTDKLITDEFQVAHKNAKKVQKKYGAFCSEDESPFAILERSWLFKEASRVVEEHNDRTARKALLEASIIR